MRFFPLLLVVLSLAVPVASAQDGRKRDAGDTAPSGIGEQVEFLKGTLSDADIGGSVVLVHFWVAADAEKAFARLNELRKNYGPRGLKVLAVCMDPPDTAREAVERRGAAADFVIAAAKKDDESARREWVDAFGGSVSTFVVSRSKVVVAVARGLPESLDRIIKLTVMNRFDPAAAKRVEPIVSSARRAASMRNYKEAAASYSKAIEQGGSPIDIGFECWRMMAEKANDPAGAKEYLRKIIDSLGKDRAGLSEAVAYLAADPSIAKRDLDSARYAAGLLKELPGAMDDSDSLVALASLAAAEGDFAAAAEMQRSAWLAAIESEKDSLHSKYEFYEQKSQGASPK